MCIRDSIDYSRLKSFNASDVAILLSYARNIPKLKGVKIGANAKIIRRKLGEFGGAWGFGIDIGAMYDYKKWRFAAMGRDITGTFNAWSYTPVSYTHLSYVPERSKRRICIPK